MRRGGGNSGAGRGGYPPSRSSPGAARQNHFRHTQHLSIRIGRPLSRKDSRVRRIKGNREDGKMNEKVGAGGPEARPGPIYPDARIPVCAIDRDGVVSEKGALASVTARPIRRPDVFFPWPSCGEGRSSRRRCSFASRIRGSSFASACWADRSFSWRFTSIDVSVRIRTSV